MARVETISRERSFFPLFKKFENKHIKKVESEVNRVEASDFMKELKGLGRVTIIPSGEGATVIINGVLPHVRISIEGVDHSINDVDAVFIRNNQESLLLTNKRKRLETEIKVYSSPGNHPPFEDALVGARLKPRPPFFSASVKLERPQE